MSLDAIKTRLKDREAQLVARLSRIEADLTSPRPRDSEERAQTIENDEVLEQLDGAERREVEAIRNALERIDTGIYTTCSSCGGEIQRDRLAALPYTSVCKACAS